MARSTKAQFGYWVVIEKVDANIDCIDLPMKRLVILNPNSRHGKAGSAFEKMLPDLQERFGKEGMEVIKTMATGHAADLVREVLQCDEYRQILIAGGDGTINEAINGYLDDEGKVIRQDIPIGIINLGTGGDFCRTLEEISEDYQTAIDENRFSIIDCGEVFLGEETEIPVRRFINISSVGLGCEMLGRLKASKFQAGAAAYFFHTIKTLIGYQPVPVEIEFQDSDGVAQSLQEDLINLFACNGRCSGGGMRWAPAAELKNGLLEMTLISGRKKLPLITQSPKVYSGRIADFPGATEWQAKEVTVRSKKKLSVEVDGEIIIASDQVIRFAVRENLLPVVF